MAYLIIVTSTTSGACEEKICHVEKFFHMTNCYVEKFLHMKNVKKIYHIEKDLHMINVEQNVLCGEMWRNLLQIVAKSVLLQFTLFCREICFVAIYAFLCGEKVNQKLCLWRKKDKYQVCPFGPLLIYQSVYWKWSFSTHHLQIYQ